MKKALSLTLALLLTALLLVGCGQTGGGSKGNPSEAATGISAVENLKTLGEVVALKSAEYTQSALYGDYYIYVFEMDGTYYRAIAPMKDAADALWALEWDDPDYDAKRDELISPLEIERWENLNDMALSQTELDALVGKTGEELFEDGWTNSGWSLNDMEFWMNKGPFSYTLVLEGDVENPDDFEEEDINSLVVKSAAYSGIGDATNIELDDDGKLVG